MTQSPQLSTPSDTAVRADGRRRKAVVWLVISSYRNDDEVLSILEAVHRLKENIFDHILVVDSDGTGRVPQVLASKPWQGVTYLSFPGNLGSGANLRERLLTAARGGADYAYALNHDGRLDVAVVSRLLEAAERLDNLGAAYSLGYFKNAHRYNLTGTRELPLSSKLVTAPPKEPLLNAFWSSSNGALYSTAPVRNGVVPWDAMWMGWEDLEYGWQLSDHGYRQVIVCDAVFQDDYEYSRTRFGSLARKPPWRTYYYMRNLVLAVRRTRNRPGFMAVVIYRFLLEFGLILYVRDCKWKRMRYLVAGLVDGLRGVEAPGALGANDA